MAYPPPYPVSRMTVDRYHQMFEAGILVQDEPIELLEGWLAVKMTKGSPHEATIARLYRLLFTRLPNGWHVRSQSPITSEDSEPEPDLTIVRGEDFDYLSHHPSPSDVPIVIEVSDSSLERDRGIKARIYARAGIPQYWIVNLIDRVVEVYTIPSGPDPTPHYSKRIDYRAGDSIPLTLTDQSLPPIPAAELLP